MEQDVQHLLDNQDLKWIFVSGKGGVGKTTTSCSLALLLAKVRRSVLIISTDPAHNISDAFDQKFERHPTLVNGYSNLYAMEVDPTVDYSDLPEGNRNINLEQDFLGAGREALREFLNTLPGIDEAMTFSEVMQLIDGYDYDVVVFDTAPTGHTLRLVSMPFTLDELLAKFLQFKTQLGGIIDQMLAVFGGSGFNISSLFNKIDELYPVVKKVSKQLKDPKRTTFVCVCIAEFLSLFETERLIQQLYQMEIDVNTIFVNQLISAETNCDFCTKRSVIQKIYLNQMVELYEDFHVVRTPLMNKELRGVENLLEFSKYMTK